MKEDGICTLTLRRRIKIVQNENGLEHFKLSKCNKQYVRVFYILLIYQNTNCLLLAIDC